MLVLVNGLPGSGKSTLARQLGLALDLPVIAKDTIKEALLDFPEIRDRAGEASIAIMYAVAGSLGSAVVDCPFDQRYAPDALAQLGLPVVEVYCACPPETAVARFEDRKANGRHPMHGPWSPVGDRPLGIGPLLTVDTTKPVDIDAVVEWLREHGVSGPDRSPGLTP